ncbi:hypothetical protein D3C74_241520 [compost metagenome]
MIDALIKTGESLKSQVEPGGMTGQMISGVEFETWAAKTIFFLEKKFPRSSITSKAVERNKNLGTNSYSNYEFLLGTLYAAKDMLAEQEKEDEESARLFDELNS